MARRKPTKRVINRPVKKPGIASANSSSTTGNSVEINLPPKLASGWRMHQEGRFADAEKQYRSYLKKNPDNINALRMYVALLSQTGRHAEAGKKLETLTRLAPNEIEVQIDRCMAQHSSGNFEAAVEGFQKVLARKPKSVRANVGMGQTLMSLANPAEAVQYFRQALKIVPGNADIQMFLGVALATMGFREEALDLYNAAFKSKPDSKEIMSSLANVYRLTGAFDKAMRFYDKLLSIDKFDAFAIAGKAQIYESQDQGDKAFELVKNAIDNNLRHVDLTEIYVRLCKQRKLYDEAIVSLRQGLTYPNLSTIQHVGLLMDLGSIYEAKKKYEEAYRFYEESNRVYNLDFDSARETDIAESIISTFSRDNMLKFPRSTNNSMRPIFIIGMPRSGTSLVEQIISCHPQVYGAGELDALRKLVMILPRHFKTPKVRFPHYMDQMTTELLDELAGKHLEYLEGLNREAGMTTDKMPQNYYYLGLIEMLFPKARIIHCVRHPLDTCFSCFATAFNPSHKWATRWSDIGLEYRLYRKLMSHWDKVLSIPVKHIVYEELVNNQEVKSRELIDFCGLPWDDACLNFHKSERVVQTASIDQVRKPIYKSSVLRHQNFDPYIQELKIQLAEYLV